MSTRSFRLMAARAFVLSALVSCSSSPDTASPEPNPPLPPLVAAVWHAHAAEGQSLPALVAHRLEQGVLVQEFLDSAQLQITSDGRWTRSLWLTRYRNQAFDAFIPVQTVGTWTATDTAYVFTASTSGARFQLPELTPGRTVSLPLRAFSEGYIEATMRIVPPEEPVAGMYRATTVRGVNVPATYEVINDYVEDGRVISIHLIVDSTRLSVVGNRRYEHTVHYSEWQGENNGPPTFKRARWVHNDFGQWTRENAFIRFESGWLQNHRVDGTVYNRNSMELLHGLTAGDPAVPVRYGRVGSPAATTR